MPLSIPLEPWEGTTGAANIKSNPPLDKQSLVTKWSASLPLNATAYSIIEDDEDPSPDLDAKDLLASFPGWPVSPRRPKRSRLVLSGDVALLALPVGFIVLAVTAWGFNGELVSAQGKAFQRGMLFGPTLFPLVFAALGGRSMRNIALWKAQRGSTIGELEKIHGSQSFVSATWLACSLRPFNILSIVLLSFWCLSPLGGQSSLRLLWETSSTTTHPIYYSDRDALSFLLRERLLTFAYHTSALMSTSIATVDTLKNSSMDTWNHPKIPRLLSLELASKKNETQTPWINIKANENTSYTSLIGVSVMGLQPNSISNFTIPYEYMYVDCKSRLLAKPPSEILDFFRPLMNVSRNIFPRTWLQNVVGRSRNDENLYDALFNATFITEATNASFTYYVSSFFLVGTRDQTNTMDNIYYATKDFSRTISVYQCSIQSLAVEASITCTSAVCGVRQIRRSHELRSPISGGGRPWDVIHTNAASDVFFRYFSSMVGMVTSDIMHPIDNYIYGNPSQQDYFQSDIVRSWSGVPNDQISQRLTEIFNTYWDLTRWLRAASRNDPYGRLSTNPRTGKLLDGLNMERAEATVIRESAIYKTSIPWVITLLFCSFVLLILGMINVVVSTFTVAPDIFGFVSSLTRGNPYVNIPGGGTMLNGTDRARLITNVKVQLGDVRAGDKVGYIALRSVASDKAARVSSIRSERLYS